VYPFLPMQCGTSMEELQLSWNCRVIKEVLK
jgi:hypothetical protein